MSIVMFFAAEVTNGAFYLEHSIGLFLLQFWVVWELSSLKVSRVFSSGQLACEGQWEIY
jgi:hypothetical protein